MSLVEKLYNEIKEIEVFDIHTHIDASHPVARGLDDILLYHMVVSDLYAAGCPSGGRMPEYPEEELPTLILWTKTLCGH